MAKMRFKRAWDFDQGNKRVDTNDLRDDKDVAKALAAGISGITVTVAYNVGWDVDAELAANADVSWVFIGGDALNEPPAVAGPALWAVAP
jgi:hypothetical protein